MQHNLTPEMKQAIKKLDKYSEQVRFVCKYKIETMSDIDNVKEKKQEEMQKILNMRNRLYYKRQKLDNVSAFIQQKGSKKYTILVDFLEL